MHIALFGASGMMGSRITAEAVRRGHQVTAVTRAGEQIDGATAVAGDASSPESVAEVSKGHDVIVCAVGPNRAGPDDGAYARTLGALIKGVGSTRLFVVGGAGSLIVDGTRLLDQPWFPEDYKPEGLAHAAGLETLRASQADWTYLSPAPMVGPGERTGSYRSGTDSPVGDSISAEDYAIAVLDELENPQHRRARFTVAT